ncbi:MAG: YlxR family protein [Myxococcota bacterium]|nr:YlxR family protein [Myxococcota bacterium]
MKQRTDHEKRTTRTCIGCGLRDDLAAMVRLTMVGDEVVFGAQFHAGRGAHLHPRPACVAKAPRGLTRAFKAEVRVDAADLGRRLVMSCDRRMVGLFLAARRRRSLAVGADAATAALREGAPLAIVALDAGSVRNSLEVERAVAAGRAMAWKTKDELGALLGEEAVAICAVRHAAIASELKFMRAAADAGAVATREGAECSRRPEAR